ncbi:MAG: agmatinase [Candidatus Bathyarchaeota archaeon]|nr:MAG: agmatinase [Candidatus Bathyarchaeota archaeon]
MERFFKPAAQTFMDSITPLEESQYAVIGAPLDLTSSHRSGSRFSPDAIRQASHYMETYSLRTGLDLEDVSISDLGNIVDTGSVEGALRNIEDAVSIVVGSEKVPVMLGGEHAVTLGALRAVRPDLVVDFDAHLDLRDRLLGLRLSHGTFMRRAMEELDFRLVIIGGRALSKEEVEYVEENDDRVRLISADDEGMKTIREWSDLSSSVYVTVDMDVVDPSSAPAVGNPSPEGISVTQLIDMIAGVSDLDIKGFDLTEVAPHFDSGLTAIQAAYIVLETIYSMESGRRARG